MSHANGSIKREGGREGERERERERERATTCPPRPPPDVLEHPDNVSCFLVNYEKWTPEKFNPFCFHRSGGLSISFTETELSPVLQRRPNSMVL